MSAGPDQLELLRDFADEALASLRSLPPHLAAYRAVPSPEPINAVFRGIYSLKGNAGFFGFTAIKSFAHAVENTLDEIRSERRVISADLERAFTSAFDLLEQWVVAAADGDTGQDSSPEAQSILAEIAAHSNRGGSNTDHRSELLRMIRELAALDVAGLITPADWLEAVADTQLDELQRRLYEPRVDLREKPEPARNQSWTPARFAAAEREPGTFLAIENLEGILRLFSAFEAGTYSSDVGREFIAAAQELAAHARSAKLVELAVALDNASRSFQAISSSPVPLDATLLEVIWDDLWPELTKLLPGTESRAGECSTSTDLASRRDSSTDRNASPTAAPEAPRRDKDAASRLVRVKEERLDEFLNLVAQLFITGEMFKDVQGRMAETRQLKPLVEELRAIIRNFTEQAHSLQKGLFSLRRVPVVNLFAKFPGMARNLARQLQKEVDVQLIGEDLEIDKVLLEDLDAPLTHIIRNAVDHGIDDPQSREHRGVLRSGRLTLKAELTRTHVRILISDDGRGIDPQRLKRKAREKRLLSDQELDAMSDEEAVQLIFHPGFSTAEKLSDVSGRGVGLDVVRSTVRKHRGEVYVQSQVNVGTTFRLELPLREAVLVIDGLMIRHDGDEFVIPFEFIREITQLRAEQLSPLHGSHVATIRDAVYDARCLGSLLNGSTESTDPSSARSAIVVGTQYGRLCVLVDEVLGTRKVVVNGLKGIVQGTPAVAGVAQLGGGHLALVLSIPEIINSLVFGSVETR